MNNSLIIIYKNEGVFPADHLVIGAQKFAKTVRSAIQISNKSDGLVTIGIEPKFASTGYGYIQFDPSSPLDYLAGFKVKTFACKLHSIKYRSKNDGDWLFPKNRQHKAEGYQIYKDTTGINSAVEKALDLKELSKQIGRQIKFEDLRKAKVSVVFNSQDEDEINRLETVHGTSKKVMSETYQKYVKVD